MSDGTRPPVDRPLEVVEDASAYYVVMADDHEDWLLRYEKDPEFPARTWATRLVAAFNRRWDGRHRPPTRRT
jgi:hypothetical protein